MSVCRQSQVLQEPVKRTVTESSLLQRNVYKMCAILTEMVLGRYYC